MFSNLNFKTKLISLCLFMSSVSLVIGGVALYGFITFSKVSDNVTKNVIPKISLLRDMDVSYQKIRIQVRTLGLDNLSKTQRELAIENAQREVANYERASKDLKQYLKTDKYKRLYSELENEWMKFKGVGVRALELGRIYDKDSRKELLEIFLVHCPVAAEKFQTSLNNYNTEVNTELTESIALSDDVAKQIEFIDFLLVIVMVGGISVGLFVGITFATKISNQFRDTIEGLTNSSSILTSNANTISKTSRELAEASQEQDAAIHESTASLEEISSMVRITAENAKTSSDLAGGSLERATKGKSLVADMNISMDSIHHSIDTIVKELEFNDEKMKQIASLISSIDEKTKVINDIVFQTKLLSFNASVEAARAGESGKGFAVVAEEVGKLAQMSGGAAVEITEMLASSVGQVNSIMDETRVRFSKVVDEVRTNVSNGTEIAKECENILSDIVTSVDGATHSVHEISTATQEQSTGINQLQTAISHVDVLSKSNTEIAHSSSDIAAQLQGQVKFLNQSISAMEVLISGHSKVSTNNVVKINTKVNISPATSNSKLTKHIA